MKIISLSGFILSIGVLALALYLHFVVAPASDIARSTEENNTIAIMSTDLSDEARNEYYSSPERIELMRIGDMKTDYGMYALFGSILPFLLCLVAAIKKQKIAYLGMLFSLTAFFIGAAYGSHMFS